MIKEEFKMSLKDLANDDRLSTLEQFVVRQIIAGDYWLVGDYHKAYLCQTPDLIKQEAWSYWNEHDEFTENYKDFQFDGQHFSDYQEFIYGDENAVVEGFINDDDEVFILVKINGGQKAVAL